MDSNQQTLRLSGLPALTRESDVKQFFNERVPRSHGRQIVESVGPICNHGSRPTKRTTVSFSSHNVAQKALDLPLSRRRFGAEHGGAGDVTLDAGFRDLTTLHSANNPETGKPDIDIIVLHGLTGHGWNSFTTSEIFDRAAGRTKETNWLRDILPRLLEQDQRRKIYSRVMTYGYNADVWMTDSVAEIDVPVNNLLAYLDSERGADPLRPLYFIAHSLGGLVAKQAVVQLANVALLNTMKQPPLPYYFPVKGCIFFGVPNQGSERADTASGILTVLNTVFSVNRRVVHDLEAKSGKLADIATQFRSIRHAQNIPVYSFFETVRYNYALGLIVNKESAVITYEGCPLPFGVDRNHREMARFTHDDAHALEPAVQFLALSAQQALDVQTSRARPRPRPRPEPVPAVVGGKSIGENKWSKLKTYDTVFLVDDSPSMAGEKWDLVKEILDYSTVVATTHDPDGIDVHFLNSHSANRDNVKDLAVAERIHHDVILQGSTPMLDQLSRHLDNYLLRFEKNRHVLNFKGYNLIILTDGKPDEDEEDPDEISDEDDAEKHSAVYRLIRKKIVQTAKDLDQAKAARSQVGIQFCQIGNEDNVQEFFEYLDDQIKGKWKLKRDMVDTVRCLSTDDLTEDFYEKLLMGAINKKLDHAPHPTYTTSGTHERQWHHGNQTAHHLDSDRTANLPHRPHPQSVQPVAHAPPDETFSSPQPPYTDGKGKAIASYDADIGIGSSSGKSQSAPVVPTSDALLAAQLDRAWNGTLHEASQSLAGGFEPPQRAPSPRTSTFPRQPSEVPEPRVNRSSTVGIGTGPKKGGWLSGYRS